MRQCILVLLVVCSGLTPVQAQTVPDSLRTRLAETQGAERLRILSALVEATYRNAPEEAIGYGREALALLAAYPDAAVEQQILFLKSQAHDHLSQWDSVLVGAERLTARAQTDGTLLTGIVQYSRGDYEKALISLEAALSRYEAEGNRARIIYTLNKIGLAHRRRSDYDEALAFFTRALELGEGVDEQIERATSLHNIGITHRQAGDNEEALSFFSQALAIREEIDDRRGLADSYNSLGIFYRRLGDFDEALASYRRALPMYEDLGDKERVASVLSNIGLVHDEQGDNAEALSAYTRALALREELGDRSGLASSFALIANVYKHQGNDDEALAFLERALTLNEELGSKRRIAANLHNIANIHYENGDVDEARDFYNRSLAIKEEIGSREGMAVTLHSLGTLHRDRSEYNEAFTLYDRALALYEELGDPEGQAIALITLGTLYANLERPDEALAATDRALELANAMGAWPLVRDAYSQRADLLEAQGNYAEALAAHRAYKAAHDSLFSTESQGVIAELQAQYRTKEQRQRIELLESRRAQQRLWLTVLLGGLGLLVIIIALMVGRMRLRRRALAVIEEAQQATEQKAAELKEKAMELERANALKSRFLANISHEFRTPLTLTFGPLDDLLAGRFHVDEGARPHLERARRNGRRLLRLINQLLDLSKLDAGALLLRRGARDLAAHLCQLASLFDSIAESRQLHFTKQIPEECLLHVYDSDKIEKVVINLLSNAFKFTQPGGKISLSLIEADDGAAQIEVADTGQGIAEEHLPHLFDRFYQVESATTRTHEGTGIGLALVKELVELHEGTITVESTLGFGTRFTVRLPRLDVGPEETDKLELGIAEEADIVDAITPGDGSAQAVAALLTTPTDVRRDAPQKDIIVSEEEAAQETVVLVVEDNADMRAYIRSHLNGFVTVVEAENGRLGLERAVADVPDLILSDVMMPEMDGLEFCQAVKTDERTSHIPVVLLTARAQVEHRIAGYESGADAYLPKPFNAGELRVRVHTLIEERRRLRALFRGMATETSNEPTGLESLPPSEAAFLKKLYAHIEEELEDTQFGAEHLAEAFHMSVRQLHRKLRALTDETPAVLIRRLRLARAAALLQQGEMTVKEIAYAVGYRSTSSFSRVFQKTYGVAPSDYASQDPS